MSDYDLWKTMSPEDEEDAWKSRQAFKKQLTQDKMNSLDHLPVTDAPITVYADGVWDPIKKTIVPDTKGVKVYREDYIYDPLGK